jgi:hypothetical protein
VTLRPAELRKLVNICRMFSTSHDGERANAASLADKLVRDHGTDWADILHAEPPAPVAIQPQTPRYWRQCAEEILFEHPQAVTEWEQEFLQDILRRGYALSVKQDAVLRRIALKCGAPAW